MQKIFQQSALKLKIVDVHTMQNLYAIRSITERNNMHSAYNIDKISEQNMHPLSEIPFI